MIHLSLGGLITAYFLINLSFGGLITAVGPQEALLRIFGFMIHLSLGGLTTDYFYVLDGTQTGFP